MYPHRNIHKYTWTSPNGKTHYEIHHILMDERWISIVVDVRSFRGSDSVTKHYLVLAGGRRSVRKRPQQKFLMERLNLKKQNVKSRNKRPGSG